MKRIALLSLLCSVLCALTASTAIAQNAGDLYKSKCQMCHGPQGKADTPMGQKSGARDFHSPAVQKETEQELFDITKGGKNKMPAYKDKLTDAQIKDVVSYVKELGKK